MQNNTIKTTHMKLMNASIGLTHVMNLAFTTKNNVNINSTPKYKTMQPSIMSLLTRMLQQMKKNEYYIELQFHKYKLETWLNIHMEVVLSNVDL